MKNNNVNKIKAIACYLVVLNHFHPSGVMGDITYTISHFGVPFFFVVSGYYFMDSNGVLTLSRWGRKLKHILYLLFMHILLYSAYEMFYMLAQGIGVKASLVQLSSYFSFRSIGKAIVIGTGIMGGGEWFLVSLIEAYCVVGIILLACKNLDIISRYAHVIAMALFVIHIPIRMYIVKSGIVSIGMISTVESYFVRNAWFDAIPFMLIGISLRLYKLYCKHPFYIISLALTASVFEYYFVNKMVSPYTMASVLYVGTIIAVAYSMSWAVMETGQENALSNIGDKYSMMIFFLHPIIGELICMAVREEVIYSNVFFEIIFCVSVMVISTICSMIISKICAR